MSLVRWSSRAQAEARILLLDRTIRAVLVGTVLACVVVGFANGLKRTEAQSNLDFYGTRLDQLAAAEASGETEFEGMPIESFAPSILSAVDRAELDLQYGSLVGVIEAILAFMATAGGAVAGIAVGAVSVGRDFERRTWFHELVSARSRREMAANKVVAAVLTLMGTLAVGSLVAVVAALVGQSIGGNFGLGAIRWQLGVGVLVAAFVGTLWVLLGQVGGFLASRSGVGAAVAGLILMIDGSVSVNSANWAGWMMTARVTGLSRLWAPTSPVFVETGVTTSIVWWTTHEEIGSYRPVGGLVAVIAFGILWWWLVRLFSSHVPVSDVRG